MLTEQEIDEIRELCDKAMPGPWIRRNKQILWPLSCGDMLRLGGGFEPNEAEFIAKSRDIVPKLLDALEESEAALERSESSHALKNARIADLEAERDSWRKRAHSFENLYGKCRNKFRPAEAEPQVQDVMK